MKHYLRDDKTGLFFRVRIGGIAYFSAQTGGNGWDGFAEGWDTQAEAEQARLSLGMVDLSIVAA